MLSSVNLALFALCLLVLSVQSQNFDENHDPTIQAINYAKQFERGPTAEHGRHQARGDPVNADPFLRELFKEFLAQYQQITREQATQAPKVETTMTTTTTTTKGPFKVQLPIFPRPSKQQSAVQRRRLKASSSPEAIKPTTTAPFLSSPPPQAAPKFQFLQNKLRATTPRAPDEGEFRRQAESAKYAFSSDIDDEINGNVHRREEIRDGLAVRGKYSYSDGYFKRTVHYEADDKGYRVVKEEVEPLIGGPRADPDGRAKVSSYVDGNTVNYQITKDDIQGNNRKVVFEEVGGTLEDEN